MRSERAETLRRLSERELDLVVVGGGVTGAGIARDAALRGLSVALLEKGDLAQGTSSASSKLIHGGLRYLENLELGLVREGVRERALLMKNAPHLARPLPFIFPIWKTSRAGPLKVSAGMWLYDALALFTNYRNHRMLTPRALARVEPALRRQGLRAATLYYDCLTDDARLTLETAIDAAERGAAVATHVEATSFRRDARGRIAGVIARDRLAPASLGDELGAPAAAGAPIEVRAKLVIAAAGPWTDGLLARAGPRARPLLRPTKGVHVVFDRARLPLAHAIVLTAVRDGRVLFAIPWGPRTVVGTTDTDDHDPEACAADARDVAYLLETTNHYFPSAAATEADVISTWAGLRPLVASDAARESDVSRDHVVVDVEPGLLAIAGGKLTTYRFMAEEAVDRAVERLGRSERCTTTNAPLPGARDPEVASDLEAFAARLAKEQTLDLDVARHLAGAYGVRARDVVAHGRARERLDPELPDVWAEVLHAVRAEGAQRLDDVLRRRTLVFLRAGDQGLGIAARVAEVVGGELGWDGARRELELRRYDGLVARSRAFRVSSPRPR